MLTTDVAVHEQRATRSRQRVVNDFSIQVATVNGSGSQTANLVLLRSILLMGVPVSGKNMFPSNIAGLPTWYTIRASRRGYVGRKKEVDVIEPMNETAGKILIEGNSAAAIGCMMAGVTVVAWYPITPSSSLCESLITYMKRYRIDKDGKATFAIVQAEDEIASLGMVIGASWAGARAMTATAGPGISLMSEFAGLGYYAETPAVIFDVQRVGPSTGLPTRTAHGDLLSTAFLSHGDTKHLMLIPCSVEESYTMAMQAFDLAEHFQTPVFVMMDLDLGMNNWMSDAFKYPDRPINRGRLLTEEVLKRLGSFGRYTDVDGDGIPYRTIPADGLPA